MSHRNPFYEKGIWKNKGLRKLLVADIKPTWQIKEFI